MSELSARVASISRHRIMIDGDGVTTLVVFNGCPLRCRYCANPYTLGDGDRFAEYTPEELYESVKIDNLYFVATGGGIAFGGGEPCLRPDFISEFRRICGSEWKLTIETSLNVPAANVEMILGVADTLVIDVKDMSPDVYREYTGRDNSRVIENLRRIAAAERQGDCLIRLPLIPGYNSDASRMAGKTQLEALGFSKFDLFTYIVR